MVSGGYPRNIETGLEIKGTDKVDTLCLLAGARKGGNSYYTTGGRVVNVVGFGETYDDARKQAYDNIKKVSFDYGFYRHDIGLFEQKEIKINITPERKFRDFNKYQRIYQYINVPVY